MRHGRHAVGGAVAWVLPVLLGIWPEPGAAAGQRRGRERAETPEDPVRAEAQAHFEAGLALMRVENYEPAMMEFERSLEIHPTRSALFNYGMCLKALYRYVEAMEVFERYLAQHEGEASAQEMATLQANLVELRRLLGEIRLVVEPAGAEVRVDGSVVGVAPLAEAVRVVVGRHRVEVAADGFHPSSQEVPVVSGETVELAVRLEAVARVGRLRVEANVVGAGVWLDGERAGEVPFTAELPEGSHSVEVRAEGYLAAQQQVSLGMGEERIVTLALVEPEGTDPGWFWGLLGVTAGAAAATAALGAVVVVESDAYEAASPRDEAAYDRGRTLMLATDICLGVAAAAAVTTLVLGFTSRWDEEAPDGGEAEAVPTAAWVEGGAVLGLAGRF